MQPVVEFLTLRRFTERARAVPDARKGELAKKAHVVTELRRGAEILWSGGAPAQGWRLVREAVAAALALGGEVAGGEAEPDATLTALLGSNAGEKAARLLAEVEQLPSPSLDEDVAAAHVQAFPRLQALVTALEAGALPYSLDDKGLRRVKLQHWLRVGIALAVTLVALGIFVRAQFRTKATASASYSPIRDAPNVLDGNPDSEWLLPNGALGWIDIQLSPSRTISRVRIINAHNYTYEDRATKDFRIEVYGANRLLKTVEGSFPEYQSAPTWTTFEIGETSGVQRVRLVVTSFHRSGGGFAEVRVD